MNAKGFSQLFIFNSKPFEPSRCYLPWVEALILAFDDFFDDFAGKW